MHIIIFPNLKNILLLLLIGFLDSCQSGTVVDDLSCGYVLVDAGATRKSIIRKDGYLTEGVLPTVEKYTYNSSFILILQKPDYNSHLKDLSFTIRARDSSLFENDSLDEKMTTYRADSLLKFDNNYQKIFSRRYNLWIITKDNLYGPLDFSEYYIKRKQLGVPEGLYLKI